MADLIDRQALRLMKTEECAGHSIEYAMGWKACIEWIRAMPSEQPEIVRCKNCKWWNEFYRECQSPNWDTKTDDYFIVPAGFFCGWGERKDDGRPD